MPVASLSVSQDLLGSAYTATLGGDWFARFTAALLLGFETDDGLMQQDMIEHGAERVLRIAALGREFDRLRGNPIADRVFYGASALGDHGLIWLMFGALRGLRGECL